jgi:hypothetical protein
MQQYTLLVGRKKFIEDIDVPVTAGSRGFDFLYPSILVDGKTLTQSFYEHRRDNEEDVEAKKSKSHPLLIS